jgi:hypothetical protein
MVLPKALRAAMNERLDRQHERWVRKLLMVENGEVRKLTEEEVRLMLQSGKPKPKPSPPQRRNTKRGGTVAGDR